MGTSDSIDDKFIEIERAVNRLSRRKVISAKECSDKLRGISRCVRVWRNGGRPADWIVNQLAAVEEDLKAEFFVTTTPGK